VQAVAVIRGHDSWLLQNCGLRAEVEQVPALKRKLATDFSRKKPCNLWP
jgi:hypothetical protein